MAKRTTPPADEATPTTLGEFEGSPIWATAIELPNVSGGLNEAMQTEPRIIGHGDEGYIVLRYQCVKVRFQPTPTKRKPLWAPPEVEDGLTRVAILHAGTATFIDEDGVRAAIERQELMNQARREAEAAQGKMPVDEHNLRGDHLLGFHAEGLVENCPVCAEEQDAADREAAGPSIADEVAAARAARDASADVAQ